MRLKPVAAYPLLLAFLLAGAAWLGKGIAGVLIADYLAAGATSLDRIEQALTWDPHNPTLRLRAAHAYGRVLDSSGQERARSHLEAAIRLRPTHSSTWFQLGLQADREGDRGRARLARDRALRLDHHNLALRWEAALLSLRWGEPKAAREHLRYVVALDSERRELAFLLMRRLLEPGEALVDLLPRHAEPLDALITTAMRQRDLLLAKAVWRERMAVPPAISTGLQRDYVEFLLREGDALAARPLWQGIVADGASSLPGNAVWNGGFEAPTLLGWGFDWQIQRVRGVEVNVDPGLAAAGRQSLRLSFNGLPSLDFSGVFQNVALEPGQEYRLRALAKAVNLTTRSGLRLQVVSREGEKVLGETPPVTGTTSGWVPLEARVHIPAGMNLVRVRLRREKASGPEGHLGGTVWVDEVSLTPTGRTAR